MKRISALALAGAAVFALSLGMNATAPSFRGRRKTVTVGGAPMYPSKNIVAERGQFEGPHHAGGGREGRRPRRDAVRRRPVHGVRADQRRLRKLPAGTVESLLKPENKDAAHQDPDLSRRVGECDVGRDQEDDQGRWRHASGEDGRRLHVHRQAEGRQHRAGRRQGRRRPPSPSRNVKQSNGVIHVIDTVLLPG